MSKEQTPIEKFISLKLDTSDITLALELKKFVEQNYLSKEEAQAKVLEALEREEEFFCENSKINAFRETLSNAEWRRLIKIHFRRSKKQK